MKSLYVDCFSGISGDMMLAALLDLGIDGGAFIREVEKINLSGFDIEIKKINKYAVTGTDVNIIINAVSDGGHEHAHGDGHGHAHEDCNEHGHAHDDGHQHAHDDGHGHDNADRSLKDIIKIIDGSGLDARVKDLSARVFMEIARAEGKVHNTPTEDVCFHEIGAVDSIIDIIGVCICINLLGVGEIYSSELHDGRGYVNTRHGRLPVPAPAVAALLSGSRIPVITEDVESELATPTGVGLIKTLARSFGPMPPMTIGGVGYGFGKRDIGRLNALRIISGEVFERETPGLPLSGNGADEIISLEANIDDMTAEAMGYAMERLFTADALDVFFTPVYMKKNRPATMLTVLARPADKDALTDVIFMETTTIGVRESAHRRTLMNRGSIAVNLESYGDVRVKIAERNGITRASPEFEDCRAYAEASGLPLAAVYELVLEKYKSKLCKSTKNKENIT